MREIVIDTETTGLNFRSGDRIIEVGCVELKNHVPTGNNLQFYCNPNKAISEGAKTIVGLSDQFLMKQKVLVSFVKKLVVKIILCIQADYRDQSRMAISLNLN